MIKLACRIAGSGWHVPARIVTNAEVAQRCNVDPDWILQNNGVKQRHWVTTETSSQLGAAAARKALAQAQLDASEIDLIINASGTQEQSIPDGGALLQRELGLGKSGIPAFSIHLTCMSFLRAFQIAATLLDSGQQQRILIVSADIASVALNFAEPESASLLGDAAAAVVLVADPTRTSGLIAHQFATYSRGATSTEVRGGGTRLHPNLATTKPEDNLFHMEGPKVLRLVATYLPKFLSTLNPALTTGLAEYDLVVPHQASKVGLRLAEHFDWPPAQVVNILADYGNCVAASIPLALAIAMDRQQLTAGQQALLIGTGAGLSIGAVGYRHG